MENGILKQGDKVKYNKEAQELLYRVTHNNIMEVSNIIHESNDLEQAEFINGDCADVYWLELA